MALPDPVEPTLSKVDSTLHPLLERAAVAASMTRWPRDCRFQGDFRHPTAPIRWQTDAETWEIALRWLIFNQPRRIGKAVGIIEANANESHSSVLTFNRACYLILASG